MMGPREGAARRQRAEEVVRTGKAVRFEDPEVDGIIRETMAYPVRSRCGKVDSIAVFSRDVTGQHRLEERMRALSRHEVAVREAERARIAHEIHDELGQQLTVMKFDLSRIVPFSALAGSVAPMVARQCAMALSRSRTRITAGPDDM